MIRPVPLAAALLLLAALWGPLPALAQHSFTAHMVMHVGVLAAAAPLLVAALPRLRAALCAHPLTGSAVLASLFELVVVWAWHSPALHHHARHGAAWLVAEQATFLLAGVWLWATAMPPASVPARRGAAVLGLLLTSMHMTLLGALLALAPRVLYHHADGETALTDQQIGGALMLAVAGSVYLVAGLRQLALLLGEGPPPHPCTDGRPLNRQSNTRRRTAESSG